MFFKVLDIIFLLICDKLLLLKRRFRDSRIVIILALYSVSVYEGPAKSFVTGSGLLQCYVLSNIFLLQTFKASVAQLDAPSDWIPGGRGFNPRRGRQHSFVEIDHEIFSTVILSLPLIQEGQLSVSGERMCTILVNRLED